MKVTSGESFGFGRIESVREAIIYRPYHRSKWMDISIGIAVQGVAYLESRMEKDEEYYGVMKHMCDLLVYLSIQARTPRQKTLVADLVSRVGAMLR